MKEKLPLFLVLLMIVGVISCGPKNEASPQEHEQTFAVLPDDQVNAIARYFYYTNLEPLLNSGSPEFVRVYKVTITAIQEVYGHENAARIQKKMNSLMGVPR